MNSTLRAWAQYTDLLIKTMACEPRASVLLGPRRAPGTNGLGLQVATVADLRTFGGQHSSAPEVLLTALACHFLVQ